MAAPATLVIAKILIPETGEPLTRGTVKMEVEKNTANIVDAAATGAGDGLRLALNIGAMLLAFIALIALLNWPLTWLGEVTGSRPPSASLPTWPRFRLPPCAARLGDRHAVAGRGGGRQPHRPEGRHQ